MQVVASRCDIKNCRNSEFYVKQRGGSSLYDMDSSTTLEGPHSNFNQVGEEQKKAFGNLKLGARLFVQHIPLVDNSQA